MDMDQIVMKTEIQPNGDILLFYVDENQDLADAGVIENDEQEDINLLSETKYVIEDTGESESADELDLAQASEQLATEQWTDEEIRRLIVFYLDNKETFQSGTTKKKHLWAVACKTMLIDKKPLSCEYKLRDFRDKFFKIHAEKLKGRNISWQFYNLCIQAFHDENPVDSYLNVTNKEANEEDIKRENNPSLKKSLGDINVDKMLNLYLQHKNIYANNINPKVIWERIARDMNEKDTDYWYKRFLNFKQHYVKMLHKRIYSGEDSINWPYMRQFDKIFENDADFQKKYAPNIENIINESTQTNTWNDTDSTFLVKYYFDCFHEFQDPTIPDRFLWHEVGRLLEKQPDSCREKFHNIKDEHFNKLLQGSYDLNARIPLEIIMDNIISKETIIELEKSNKSEPLEDWDTDSLDILVQFIYDNINMVKDTVCYYVCLATIAKKLESSLSSCKKQWDNLTTVYKSILNDKMENPEIQIDWRYIDMFDIIFDYGMDTHLLEGYGKLKKKQTQSGKIGVKKINIKDIEDSFENGTENSNDNAIYDERGFTMHSKRKIGDEKAFKILEYYLKNKDKFTSTNYKKVTLWETLAKQIGMTATECAHRFRNYKQIYITNIHKEINKPEAPVVWPYYALCKKIFGYRAIKSKIKNSKANSSDNEDWSAREIKRLINYVSANFNNFIEDIESNGKWTEIANELGRTETSCCEKFLELRKSYRKLKTMKANNPDTKVSWRYFSMMNDMYSNNQIDVQEMDVDSIKPEVQDDDDFQCIIVIPEGEDINEAQIMYQNKNEQQVDVTNIKSNNSSKIWNRRMKIRLLNLYLKYLKSHNNQEINSKEMWTEIAAKMDDKLPSACKRMFLLLKNRYNDGNILYKNLMQKILAIKPTFKTKIKRKRVFKDVQLSDEKVENALNYYLRNLEDFFNPKFEKKYLWSELARFVSEPVKKVYNKINYLKQSFSNDSETPFQNLLKEITLKENALKENLKDNKNPTSDDSSVWTDIEIERLLTWYLAHLDKFKNPKFVRSYLWMEASDILKKSPLDCSKKMLEMRSQYRTMFKESPEKLQEWRFYNLCQRIYGTGKKSNCNE